MKAQDSPGIAAYMGAVLVSLAVTAMMRPGAAATIAASKNLRSPQAAEEKPLRGVELLVLEDGATEVKLGLHVELAPGWYLYWLNPGDAGLAPEVRWELPAGHEAGKLRFPTPQKIVHGGIVTYGFTGETLILCDVKRPATPKAAEKRLITAVLEWMVCRDSCVTGVATVRTDLSGPSPVTVQRSRRAFSRFTTRFPKPGGVADLTVIEARLAKPPGRWAVEITLSGKEAARVSDFYPYPLEDFVIDHHGIAIAGGRLSIPVVPSFPAATLSQVSGLLIIDGAGFEVSIPVKERNPKP